MITKANFLRFRGFERLSATLIPHAYIVGPNSAGKSTVIEAIGLAEQCLRVARRRLPPLKVRHNGITRKAFPLPPSSNSEEDPVRHEFGRLETRVSVFWETGACIHIVWPEETDDYDDYDKDGYFYLEEADGGQPKSLEVTRKIFSGVTVIPVITPIDRVEDFKDPGYIEKHRRTRLASRHFRNHSWHMSQTNEWALFKDYCDIWLPEIKLLDVSRDASMNRLSVFYSEPGSRVPKELAWAGDGIQIWVQLLWHIFRANDPATIVLDEPEVYLHPDLQRRLVRLLDGLSKQVILASHSADVIAEAPPDAVLWVDRRCGGARRANSQQSLAALSESLGTSYNLALARSMRSRLVVASDCEDNRVIRLLAKQVGANNIANENIVSFVQLRDVRNWSDTNNLGTSLREVLPGRLPAVILIQTGHRPAIVNNRIRKSLSAPGITVKIWSRTEIENYLLDANAVARVSGAAPEIISLRIAEAHSKFREITRAAYISERVASASEGQGQETLTAAENEFDTLWVDSSRRVEFVRGSLVMKELNLWLESDGYRPINAYLLAKAARPQSLVPEVFEVLLELDELLV